MKKQNNQPTAPARRRGRARMVILRGLLLLFTLIVMLTATLLVALSIVANGPSKALRDTLVLSAMQASATKWVPGLFLSDAEIYLPKYP